MAYPVPDAGPLFLVTHFEHAFHAARGCACLLRLPARFGLNT